MRVLIVGGGITGLSAAWFVRKKHPNAEITLFEKEARLGGWIRTRSENGYFFEQGPRTFPLSRSPHLLSLIEELGLEIIYSNPSSKKRYILHKGRLRPFSYFLPLLFASLWKAPFFSPAQEDESIYSYASRRFSPKIAETLFDPLTLGIYAGDIHKLSVRSCFPTFFKNSLFKAFVSSKGLFTLKTGMESLIHALQEKLPIEFLLNCPVEKMGEKEVVAQGKQWKADLVISALPPPLPARSIWVVHLGYEKASLSKKGFGYLIPTKEKQPVLGVVFDSEIFPQQNQRSETRLTAMVRGEEKEPLRAALTALERDLGLTNTPDYTTTFFADRAIAQFEVGCTYPYGISVDASIERGKRLSLCCHSSIK